MPSDQISFTDVEYANRRRVSRREQFLDTMDATIPWSRWVGLNEPFYYSGHRGRKPKALETMLRMYLLQVWFSLSDEGVENAIYDSYAMRQSWDWTSRSSRSPTPRRCCTSGTYSRSINWAGSCLNPRGRYSRSRAGSCTGEPSSTRRSSPRHHRRRTLVVPVILRCARR